LQGNDSEDESDLDEFDNFDTDGIPQPSAGPIPWHNTTLAQPSSEQSADVIAGVSDRPSPCSSADLHDTASAQPSSETSAVVIACDTAAIHIAPVQPSSDKSTIEYEPSDMSNGNDSDEEIDNPEETAVAKAVELFDFLTFPNKTCHCHCQLYGGRSCIEQFNDEEKNTIKMNIQEMTCYEKDLLLLGIISCSINLTEMTLSKKQKNVRRKKNRIRHFFYEHRRICRDTFMYLFDISKIKLQNLREWYATNGLIPRKKKSGGRQKTALNLEDIQYVTRFLINFADQHSLLLPGRIPGFKRSDVRILPSNETKASIWRMYKQSAVLGQRCVQLSTFRQLWKQLLPFIVVAKPMSDLCWVCQQNNTNIVRSVNVSEHEKSAVLKAQELHLLRATAERSHYTSLCETARKTATTFSITDFHKSIPNSLPAAFHYSFDYAQQVLYPANPMQPGPIYFKVPRRCGIFGIHAEGIGNQMNYLIDESVTCGKGANGVISMLHHFLENFGAGEQHLELNADNCAGQNKNAYLLWYLSWRVANKLNESATISFMLAGHTKFAPDWCFGLFKRQYRHTFVSSLADIEAVALASSQTGVNKTTLVGNEQGDVFVPMYDWVSHLKPYYKKVPGVTANHHFKISADNPGVVELKVYVDSSTTKQTIALAECPKTLPAVIEPKGMDAQRKRYLFQHIREFCREETKDIVCPDPGVDVVSERDDTTAECNNADQAEDSRQHARGRRNQGRKKSRELSDTSDTDYEPLAKQSSRGHGRGRGGGRGRGRPRNK
jgi:hypothetical protein